MAKTSATQRTLNYLRKEGMVGGVVERFIRFGNDNDMQGRSGVRKDLFGFIDVVALDPDNQRTIGIQAFTTAMTEHYRKITETPEIVENARKWLLCNNVIWLMGWRKVKLHRGSKAIRWKPRIREITITDLDW